MLKEFHIILSLSLIFCFSATLVGSEEMDTYFPHALGSFWVYEDQDGNELTRRAIQKKKIGGKIYHAFSYEPTLEDWTDYDYHIHRHLYQVGKERVTFWVGDDVQKAVKARLTREVETFRKLLMEVEDDFNNLLYDIEVEGQDLFYVLPISVTLNEKWDAAQIKAKVTMKPDPPDEPEEVILEFSIVETGNVVSMEDLETPTGTFEDCLKIEYRTKTEGTGFPSGMPLNPPGESVTTLWVVPNIGIVKFHQKTEDILLKVLPHPQVKASTTVKAFELKKYEIKSAGSEGE